jgi:hypothetical protein
MAKVHAVVDRDRKSRPRARVDFLARTAACVVGTMIVALSLIGGAFTSAAVADSPTATSEPPNTGAALLGGTGTNPVAPSVVRPLVLGPIVPPNDPPANDIGAGQCINNGTNTACLADINTARADQEGLSPIVLPLNWTSLTSAEKMFVFTNLERTSRNEAPIPNLVSTYDTEVQAGVQTDADPVLPIINAYGSIWAGGTTLSLLGAFDLWMYDDGPGGLNRDCDPAFPRSCWGHRNIILANASNLSSDPTEMDAVAGTDTLGNPSYAAAVIVRTGDTPVTFTWTQEQPFLTNTPPPTVTSISPTTGSQSGGTSVLITGTNLTGATAVDFGTVASTHIVVNSATQITATSPAEAAGTVGVTATTPGGTSAQSAADQFTYASAPTVTAISPTFGPIAGGTSVTITGTNFTGATSVLFGTTAATNVTVVSSTQVTATSPALAAGAQNVHVVTPFGTSATNTSDVFTYFGTPTVTSISPTTGSQGGGTSLVITGTNLAGATAVDFGTVASTHIVVNSATQITATAPAQVAGTVNVTATTPGGTSAQSAADQFTYGPAPTVTAISPTFGPAAGGTSVTITGTSFTGATSVLFGTTAATSFTVVSATQVTATSPALAAGAVYVNVVTPFGQSANHALFIYKAPPTVTSISPTSGSTAGGTSVVITGTNFVGATAVHFGSVASTHIVVNSATQITATTPAEAAGTVNVTVTAQGGTSTGTAGQFTFN